MSNTSMDENGLGGARVRAMEERAIGRGIRHSERCALTEGGSCRE